MVYMTHWSTSFYNPQLSFKMNFKTKGNYYVGQASSQESTANICVKIEVYNCLNGQLYKDKFPGLPTFYILAQLFPLSGPIQLQEQTMAMSLPARGEGQTEISTTVQPRTV